ncbi:hypothetical protein L2E82_43284 [Cichorium intybus]|uniref:Uncharacterized protein n=1 Tax=Cichorium intybus TaxID=13427 RepID=A0ACB8ZNB5_CICIN|nr:hypothetical protein L2E82_43284 [Cichorium intybus]
MVNMKSVNYTDKGEEGHRTEAEIQSLRAAFTQEVVVWHKLDHPNVTKFIGATMGSSELQIRTENGQIGMSSDICCVVVEYLPDAIPYQVLRGIASLTRLQHVPRREGIEESFENGTLSLSFLNIASIRRGFTILITFTTSAISRHTLSLARYTRNMLLALRHANSEKVSKIYGLHYLKGQRLHIISSIDTVGAPIRVLSSIALILQSFYIGGRVNSSSVLAGFNIEFLSTSFNKETTILSSASASPGSGSEEIPEGEGDYRSVEGAGDGSQGGYICDGEDVIEAKDEE